MKLGSANSPVARGAAATAPVLLGAAAAVAAVLDATTVSLALVGAAVSALGVALHVTKRALIVAGRQLSNRSRVEVGGELARMAEVAEVARTADAARLDQLAEVAETARKAHAAQLDRLAGAAEAARKADVAHLDRLAEAADAARKAQIVHLDRRLAKLSSTGRADLDRVEQHVRAAIASTSSVADAAVRAVREPLEALLSAQAQLIAELETASVRIDGIEKEVRAASGVALLGIRASSENVASALTESLSVAVDDVRSTTAAGVATAAAGIAAAHESLLTRLAQLTEEGGQVAARLERVESGLITSTEVVETGVAGVGRNVEATLDRLESIGSAITSEAAHVHQHIAGVRDEVAAAKASADSATSSVGGVHTALGEHVEALRQHITQIAAELAAARERLEAAGVGVEQRIDTVLRDMGGVSAEVGATRESVEVVRSATTESAEWARDQALRASGDLADNRRAVGKVASDLRSLIGQVTALETYARGATSLVVSESKDAVTATDERLSASLNNVRWKVEQLAVQVSQVPGNAADLTRLTSALIPQFADLPPLGGWAVKAPTIAALVTRVMNEEAAPVVLECGSGASTVWFALAARDRGEGHVYALEHEPRFAAQTRGYLERNGLSEWATVLDAPLTTTTVDGRPYEWYETTGLAALPPVTVLFVDGPPAATGVEARFPAFPVLAPMLRPDGILVLDDTVREEEKAIVRRWLAWEEAPVRLTVDQELPEATIMRVSPR